jgi:hypothetical protein
MFWIFISLVALAFAFAKLGAIAVMVKVLTSGLIVAVLAIVALFIARI